MLLWRPLLFYEDLTQSAGDVAGRLDESVSDERTEERTDAVLTEICLVAALHLYLKLRGRVSARHQHHLSSV